MWLTTALNNWKWIVIASLGIALLTSIGYGKMVAAERDAKTQEIESMRLVAQNYEDRSTQTAKETSDAFTTLVESIKSKDTAIDAARAKFGSCNVAGGITVNRLPNVSPGISKADVPESTGRVSQPEHIPVSAEFVNGCASDSAFVGAIHEWRIANDLEVK